MSCLHLEEEEFILSHLKEGFAFEHHSWISKSKSAKFSLCGRKKVHFFDEKLRDNYRFFPKN